MIGKYLNGYLQQYSPPPGWDRFLAFDKEAASYDYMLGGQLHGSRTRDYSTDVIARKAGTLIQTAATTQPCSCTSHRKLPTLRSSPRREMLAHRWISTSTQ